MHGNILSEPSTSARKVVYSYVPLPLTDGRSFSGSALGVVRPWD